MTRHDIQSTFVRLFAAESGSPADAKMLGQIEAQLGVTFPQSFLDFATRYGDIYTPSILDMVTGGESEIAPEGASFDIQNFMSASEIVEATKMYWSGGMDDSLVVFASDCMGNVFGFRKQRLDPRPDDSPVFVFDHDFVKIKLASSAFDIWLDSFVQIRLRSKE